MDKELKEKLKEKLKEQGFAGYISSIEFPDGEKYKLMCEVVTVNPIIYPKCGNSFELKYGNGKCDYCGTYFTTHFELREE